MTEFETTVLDGLTEIRARLDRLEAVVEPRQSSLKSTEAEKPVRRTKRTGKWPTITYADPSEYREHFAQVIRDLGFDPQNVPTAEEVRAEMVAAGLRPEDRVANTILSEMRGYGPNYGEE